MTSLQSAAALLLPLFSLLGLPAPDASAAELTEAARLSAVYDSILGAHFARAREQLRAACPPAPVEACRALEGVVQWWEILIDPDDRSRDAGLRRTAESAIDAAEAWTRREPKRAEAWFYLAGAYAPLVQLKVLRGERLSAARDGNRIRAALERAVALDPNLNDAYFGIGLYHYYADVAPAAAKILRVLMLLPGGDRKQGLQEMLRARSQGVLLSGEADYQLHWLYLWYEHEPQRALELVRGLDARYPSNPVFLQRIAEIERDDLHDRRASLRAWELLLERARAGSVESARLVEARAQLEIGRDLIALGELDRAVDRLKALIDAKPSSPYSVRALAELSLATAYDRLGKRDLATSAYRAAIADAPEDDRLEVRDRARDRLRDRNR